MDSDVLAKSLGMKRKDSRNRPERMCSGDVEFVAWFSVAVCVMAAAARIGI